MNFDEFKEEQKQAITERGKNILVSAAAGSGKTSVLVERVKKLIIGDNESVKNMLIVTFTEKAASEMKSRIIEAISKEIKETNDNDKKKRLKRELVLIPSSNISTFHSFAMEVIKRFYYLINIEPNLKVVDDAEERIMLEESLDELIDGYFKENNEVFLDYLDRYTDGKRNDAFRDVIIELYQKIMSLDEPFTFLHSSLKYLDVDENNIGDSLIYRKIKELCINNLNSVIGEYKGRLEKRGIGPKERSLYLEDLSVLELFKNDIISTNFDGIQKSKSFVTYRAKEHCDYEGNDKEILKDIKENKNIEFIKMDISNRDDVYNYLNTKINQ